jgi:sugar (pentulose or hexulose) kinase
VVEAQMMSMALHSTWMRGHVDRIHATGGGSANHAILQVMADVFGAEVCQFRVGHSACLGAALRALHADRAAAGLRHDWDEIVSPVVGPLITFRLQPDRKRRQLYRDLMDVYSACEARALGCGDGLKPVQ